MQREFICGDCMNFLPDFPDNYFDVAVVDPPYGIKEHGGKNRSKYVKQKNGSSIYVPDGGYKNYGWDNKPPDREYFKQLFRVSKNQIIWGCNYFDYPMAGGLIIWINAMMVQINQTQKLLTAVLQEGLTFFAICGEECFKENQLLKELFNKEIRN